MSLVETESPPVTKPSADRPARISGKRLPRPSGAGRVNWRYVIPIAAIHFLALAALVPQLFSWSGLILCLIGTHVFGTGINIGYHRLLTHRSFQCPEFVERIFVLLAICCLEDSPASWVTTHRMHHKDSDHVPDPHSPLVNFWWSHVGWLLATNDDVHNSANYDRVSRDILRKPFYLWLQRGFNQLWIWTAHAALITAAGFGIGWAWTGAWQGGVQLALSWFVWVVVLRTAIVWHMAWSVNSLSHLFGYRTFATREESRNNWFVAWISAGEGWHNNHHGDPTSATNWLRWWEFDLSYLVICSLECCGLAWNVNRPRRTSADEAPAESA